MRVKVIHRANGEAAFLDGFECVDFQAMIE